MKWSPGALFCEQVGELTRVFSQWNECEQTVVLYALLRRIPAVQARFLAHAVQHSLHSVTELDSQELNANNPGKVEKNCKKMKKNRVQKKTEIIKKMHT